MLHNYKVPILIGALFTTASVFLILTHFNESSSTISPTEQIDPREIVQARVIDRSGVNHSWIDQLVQSISNQSNFVKVNLHNNDYKVYNSTSKLMFDISETGFIVNGSFMDKAKWSAEFHVNNMHFDNAIVERGDLESVILNENKLTYFFENFAIEYINSAEGLRQNFIAYENKTNSKEISVDISINSELNAHVVANSLVLTHNNIQLFTYRDLQVFDNNGLVLQAEMKISDNNKLALVTNVEYAEFPVTIDPISTGYAWMQQGNSFRAGFGFWISGNGDVNGDGFKDIVIGAPDFSNTLTRQGAFFVYHGSSSGVSLTPALVIYGDNEFGSLGKCLSIEGDVNGDGYDDLIVGAHQYTNPHKYEGKAYVHLGGPDGIDPTPIWQFEANRKGAKLGEAVSFAGDVNGDGFDDIVIGAHGWDNTEEMGDDGSKAGKFWIFNGNASGVDAVASMSCVADVEDANLGISLDKAGDVNGDGYDDIHIGGYIFLIGDGMLCTFHGGPSGVDAIPDFMAVGGAHDTSFYAVNLSNAGDLNGDGYNDVVIGAPRFDAGGIYQAGKLHVHFGGPGGLDTAVGFTLSGTHYDERYAFNVNDAHDLNSDGYGDLLVTSKFYSPGATPTETDTLNAIGEIYLYLGGPNLPQSQPVWKYTGTSAHAVGTNVGFAGDVNGDGQEDIILSGSSYSGDFDSEGAAYVFHGIPQVCDPPKNLSLSAVSATSASLAWDWLYGSTNYKVYLKKVGEPGAPVVLNTNNSAITLTGLLPATVYKVYIKSKCEAGYTSRSNIVTIHTPPMRDGQPESNEISIFPNPVQNILNISSGNFAGDATVQIYNLSGEIVFTQIYSIEVGSVISIPEIAELANGVYLLNINQGNNTVVRKFTKSN